MNDLDDLQTDRLESALASFDRRDEVARERLFAALAADVPSKPSSHRNARSEKMKRYFSRTAAAAALLLAPAIAWYLWQPKTVLAQVAQAMSRAKGFRCDFIQITPGDAGDANAKLAGHIFWTPSGEERLDFVDGNKPEFSRIFLPGKAGLLFHPGSKQYQIIPKSSAREFSFGLFGSLGEFKGKTERLPGTKEIRGVKAEGFTVPWPSLVGDDTHANAKVEVWLDPVTKLPVRVDILGLDPLGILVMRLESFQWGRQDPKLFDVTVPAGYAKIPTNDVKAEAITEYVVYGLSIFAKYNNGKYPTVKYIYGDEQGEALRKLMGMPRDAMGWVQPNKNLKWPKVKDGEFAHGSYGLSWINTIQRDFPEGVYNGKTVTPQDAKKVLVRWQLDDGDYRVIFGDLSSATVSASRLRELEAR